MTAILLRVISSVKRLSTFKKVQLAMNYFGYISKPDQMDAHTAGLLIKSSLSKMYAEARFLGAFENVENDLRYVDTNEGNVTFFQGKELIYRKEESVTSYIMADY